MNHRQYNVSEIMRFPVISASSNDQSIFIIFFLFFGKVQNCDFLAVLCIEKS